MLFFVDLSPDIVKSYVSCKENNNTDFASRSLLLITRSIPNLYQNVSECKYFQNIRFMMCTFSDYSPPKLVLFYETVILPEVSKKAFYVDKIY